MNEQKQKERFRAAVDHRLSGLQGDPWLARRIIAGEKGEKKVKKKISLGLVLSMMIVLCAAVALAENIPGLIQVLETSHPDKVRPFAQQPRNTQDSRIEETHTYSGLHYLPVTQTHLQADGSAVQTTRQYPLIVETVQYTTQYSPAAGRYLSVAMDQTQWPVFDPESSLTVLSEEKTILPTEDLHITVQRTHEDDLFSYHIFPDGHCELEIRGSAQVTYDAEFVYDAQGELTQVVQQTTTVGSVIQLQEPHEDIFPTLSTTPMPMDFSFAPDGSAPVQANPTAMPWTASPTVNPQEIGLASPTPMPAIPSDADASPTVQPFPVPSPIPYVPQSASTLPPQPEAGDQTPPLRIAYQDTLPGTTHFILPNGQYQAQDGVNCTVTFRQALFEASPAFRSRQETVDFSPEWLDFSLDGFQLSVHAGDTPSMQVRYLEPDRYTVEISGSMEFTYPQNVWYLISATGDAEALPMSWQTDSQETSRPIGFDYTFRLPWPKEQGE